MATRRDHELLASARLRCGLIRLADAERAGWTHDVRRRLIERGVIERLYDEVFRVSGAPDSWRSRALAAAWAGGELSGLSHRSAAKLYGLAGASRDPIEILCPRWERAQHAGLHVHEFTGLQPSDFTVVAGLPVVVGELAVLHVAGRRRVTIDDVERAIYAVRRKRIVTNSSLEAYLYRRARRGRPGVRKLRAALERSREHARPTESEMETLLLHTLRRHGFPEPTLQFEIRDRQGRFVARVDAALEEWDILLEYDSTLHHTDVVDTAKDDHRRAWAAEYGYWMIPVRHADLQEGGRALAAALRGAIARLDRAQPA